MGGSAGWTRDIGDGLKNLAVICFSTRCWHPWVLACTRPKTCDQHDLRHVNGSDRDALEGGRELGWVSYRHAVIANMAKWGVGEVSGARASPVEIDQFGMLGVRTVVGDGLG